MSDEAKLWLAYAQENLQVAKMSLEGALYNACIQNAQQATEKALKGLRLSAGMPLKRTHSIRQLRDDLKQSGPSVRLTDDECDLLDSVYLPSKYPLGPALPRFDPDERIARQCLDLAERVLTEANRALKP